jgi:hypothetical protein
MPALCQDEHSFASKMIYDSYLGALKSFSQDIYRFVVTHNMHIKDYHRLAISNENHAEIWQKKNRILDNSFADLMRGSSLFAKIAETFPDFEISDEEQLGRPNFYWRLVRPNTPQDIGPFHRDSWFWNISKVHGLNMANKV